MPIPFSSSTPRRLLLAPKKRWVESSTFAFGAIVSTYHPKTVLQSRFQIAIDMAWAMFCMPNARSARFLSSCRRFECAISLGRPLAARSPCRGLAPLSVLCFARPTPGRSVSKSFVCMYCIVSEWVTLLIVSILAFVLILVPLLVFGFGLVSFRGAPLRAAAAEATGRSTIGPAGLRGRRRGAHRGLRLGRHAQVATLLLERE